MSLQDSTTDKRSRKLDELRGALAKAVQAERLHMSMWWQGVLFGRLWELEDSNVLTVEDRNAFELEMKKALGIDEESLRQMFPT